EEPDDDVYFVLEGRARAATYTDTGREVRLSDLEPGEGFGFLAAIDGGTRSTNVIAVERSRFARISAQSFNAVINGSPAVSRAFMLYFVELIRELSERMTEVTTQSAEKRLVRKLLSQSRPITLDKPGAPSDSAIVQPLPTQQELASMIFSQRETVGREMSQLQRRGLVERQRRSLIIPSVVRLEAYLNRK
ncbi:MAG: Crp/Fnr family transcriptional regulator, partial [Pseudomonadota bacterium]